MMSTKCSKQVERWDYKYIVRRVGFWGELVSSYDLLTIKARGLIVTGLKAEPVGSRDSVVGLVTRHSLGRSLFESPWIQVFLPPSWQTVRPKQPSAYWAPGLFPEVKPSRRGVNHQPHLGPRFRLGTGVSAIYFYIFSTRSSCVTGRDTVYHAQVRLAEITIVDARPALNNSHHPSQVHSGQQKSSSLNSCKYGTGSDLTSSCHHSSYRSQFPYNFGFTKILSLPFGTVIKILTCLV